MPSGLGGSADRRLSARLSRASRTVGNPRQGHPDSGEAVFLCIANARLNFRFCTAGAGGAVGWFLGG